MAKTKPKYCKDCLSQRKCYETLWKFSTWRDLCINSGKYRFRRKGKK